MRRLVLFLFALTCVQVLTADRAAIADPEPSPSASSSEPPLQLHWQHGPDGIDLGHGALLALPAHRSFLRGKEAVDLMEKMGNLYNEDLLGIVVSDDPDADYMVTLRYVDEGYVKDDEKIDAKAILDTIVKGEPEYNEERQKRGFSPIHAEGWAEEPRYDRTRHELVWALLVSSAEESSVNLNTRVLGRHGHISVNLVTDRQALPRYRDEGLALVEATNFKAGDRYEDFDKSKDRVAEYGLAGLILGGVGVGVAVKAAKVGLLAALWKPIVAFLLAAKKAVIALVVGAGALVKKLLGRKEKKTAQAGS
jgi:uncharacterized membrane-anchored protein